MQSQKRNKEQEVVQHRPSTPEGDDKIISVGGEGPDQWQNDPEEEITVEFRDKDNVEPEQQQVENEDQIAAQGNDEIAERIVPVQEDGLSGGDKKIGTKPQKARNIWIQHLRFLMPQTLRGREGEGGGGRGREGEGGRVM